MNQPLLIPKLQGPSQDNQKSVVTMMKMAVIQLPQILSTVIILFKLDKLGYKHTMNKTIFMVSHFLLYK